MKYLFFSLAVILLTVKSFAQVAINADGSLPNNSAGLDVKFIDKGFLPPRLTTVQRNAIVSPAAGLIIYNTDLNRIEYYGAIVGWGPLLNASNGWTLNGNSGSVDGTNFIGTMDNIPLTIRVNNQKSGRIDHLLQNVFWGYQAGLNSIGSNNTAVGSYALTTNSMGGSNTAFGRTTLFLNNIGAGNSAFGSQALYSNTSGNNNVAYGASALYYNSGGSYGTAIGANAMMNANNSTAPFINYNVAVGFEALKGSNSPVNNTGNYNTVTGFQALSLNSTGSSNTAFGSQTLANNSSGYTNTSIGSQAMYSNTIGYSNTANGFAALYLNQDGSTNCATGYYASYSNTTGSRNTSEGYQAMQDNQTGGQNTACGYQAMQHNVSGGSNSAFGIWALSNATGSNNIGIGYDAQVSTAAGNNQVRIGNSSIGYAGIQVGWSVTSDRRLKGGIRNSELGLDFINKLNPVSYYRLNDENQKTEFGFVAQEVEETLNESGAFNNGIITKDDEGQYSMRYNDLIAPMVKAIQELTKQNQELLKRIEKIENK